MASLNISGGANPPQLGHGLLGLLSGLDQASVESYLSSSEGSSPKLRSPFSGLLLSLKYDPVEVLDLVDELWPERVSGHRGSGRKLVDRLPFVCYILPLCDPEYGTVFKQREAYRRLKEHQGYRSLCGYGASLPSYSVFRSTADAIVKNWLLFQVCQASPDRLETLLAQVGAVSSGGSTAGRSSPFVGVLPKWGWQDNLPPSYRNDDEACKASRVIGLPRGRTCGVRRDSDDIDACGPSADVSDASSSSGTGYRRDWHAYNGAQTHEVTEVKALLGGLSDLISLTEGQFQGTRGKGRPAFPLGHAVFAVLLKAYSGLASRRLESLLRESVEQGYLRNVSPCALGGGIHVDATSASDSVRIPQFNTVSRYLRCGWLTPLLLELVTVTARPLRTFEHVFAVDGTGWGSRWYDRWLDHHLADESDRKQWMKLHLVVGVESNIIALAAISPGSHHDHPYFRPLVIETAKHFDVERVVADMGYSSRSSYELGGELGVDVRIPFKSNTRPLENDGSEWSKNLEHFLLNYDKFMEEYHPRSNVESTNSALKVVLPEKLRTKVFDSQTNEALAKVVAYNIRGLAREVRMRDIPLDLPAEGKFLEDCIRHVVEMRRCDSLDQAP